MTDDINKKISIDVEINNAGQQQITQYKIAFDDFRNSINSIRNPLSGISGDLKTLNKNVTDISGSLTKLNTTASSFNSTGSKIGGIISTTITSFVGLKNTISDLGLVLGDFTAELTGGISLLISFLPVIIDWVSDLFKADTTTKSLNQTLREHKTALDAVRQAHAQGAQDAQDELTRLKLLYKASQDHNLSLKERKKAVSELQSQYPTYFGNLSQEAILAGSAAGQYKDLTKYILAAAQARAAEDMMTDNSKRQLTDKAKTDDLQKQIDEKKQQLNALEKQYQQAEMTGNGQNSSGAVMKENMDKLYAELNALETQYGHIDTDSKILDQRNKALSDDVAANVEKNGTKVLTGLQTTADKGDKIVTSSSEAHIKSVKKQTKAYDTLSKKIDEVNAKQKSASQPDSNSPEITASTHGSPSITQSSLNHSLDNVTSGIGDSTGQDQTAQLVSNYETAFKKIDVAAKDSAVQIASDGLKILSDSIQQQTDAKLAALEQEKDNELNNTNLTGAQKLAIQAKFKKQEDQLKAQAFKKEQELSVAQAVINGALAVTKVTAQDGVFAALEIGAIVAETAAQISKIESQKPPAYAAGGLHYASDGRGGVLPGYSRTDNTNAYLRSGEGIVVSEAMRDPWARNLVSAINVGFGGRDFSISSPSRGYAVGGIFTDGGDANRYYNAPVNDQKNLANTIAYQMINNFPPVYVDVKDINNQQNILAQTINRVNL